MPFRTTDSNRYTLSTNSSTDEFRSFVTEAEEELSSQVRVSVTRDDGELNFEIQTTSDSLERRMPPSYDEPDEAWLYEEASNIFGAREVAEMFAGEHNDGSGWPAVKHELFEHTAESLAELTVNDPPVYAFNSVTDDWPRRIREQFAGYEAEHSSRTDEYDRKIAEYAESAGTGDYELMQTELEWYFADNPFDDERLSDEDARLILKLRGHGYDADGETLDAISDVSRFREWLNKTGDVEAALHAHHFDANIPEYIAEVSARPSMWPDDMDPSAVEWRNCVRCGTSYYEIYSQSERIEWTSENGEIQEEVAPAHSEDNEFFDTTERYGNRGGMCQTCQQAFDESYQVIVLDGAGNVSHAAMDSNVRRDYGADDDRAISPMNSLASPLREAAMQSFSGRPNGYIGLTPREAPAAEITDLQREALSEIFESLVEVRLPNEPLIIHRRESFDGYEFFIYVNRNDVEAAREAKEMLEAFGEAGIDALA